MNLFESICTAAGLGEPVPEFCFAPPRKWRFDWCWPEAKVALEIEGGIWIKGRHNRGSGFKKDMEKYNAAACLGWRIIRCTPDEFANGSVIDTLAKAMKGAA